MWAVMRNYARILNCGTFQHKVSIQLWVHWAGRQSKLTRKRSKIGQRARIRMRNGTRIPRLSLNSPAAVMSLSCGYGDCRLPLKQRNRMATQKGQRIRITFLQQSIPWTWHRRRGENQTEENVYMIPCFVFNLLEECGEKVFAPENRHAPPMLSTRGRLPAQKRRG